MHKVVLGVSGSVSAYRACDLARDLMRAGHKVRVCLTDSGEKFVTRSLFEALTGQPCLADTFEEPVAGRMAHIDWARSASVLLIAPATANTVNKLAAGVADDMLTTLALAYEGPVVIAPAMNPSMYSHETTQESLRRLAERGVVILEPAEGDVACGETGQGKLASNQAILEAVQAVLERGALTGRKVVITSGPTREPWDSVRYLSNRSSGKMGLALAKAASLMGAEVVLVTGPTGLTSPRSVATVEVESAAEMLSAALEASRDADLVVGAAAVADYRPSEPVSGKIRRSDGDLVLNLTPNPDVIAEVARANPKAIVVAFAAEPDGSTAHAVQKMARKGVAAIATNDVSRADIGFGSDHNELTLLFADGTQAESGRQSKLACAFWLLGQLAGRL